MRQGAVELKDIDCLMVIDRFWSVELHCESCMEANLDGRKGPSWVRGGPSWGLEGPLWEVFGAMSGLLAIIFGIWGAFLRRIGSRIETY